MNVLKVGAYVLKELKCKCFNYYIKYISLDIYEQFIYSKDVRLPVQLQRAMAAEAEAAREARAKVIAAEGEHKASRALKEAAEIINESPIALQLRYLQTLTAIASERNSTIVFPVSSDFYLHLSK